MKTKLPKGKPYFVRIGTIPEAGSFETMREITLQAFCEQQRPDYMDHFGFVYKGPPPLKDTVIADCQGCSVATCNGPVTWTVDDLNERMPGMYGNITRRTMKQLLFDDRAVEFIKRVWPDEK